MFHAGSCVPSQEIKKDGGCGEILNASLGKTDQITDLAQPIPLPLKHSHASSTKHDIRANFQLLPSPQEVKV